MYSVQEGLATMFTVASQPGQKSFLRFYILNSVAEIVKYHFLFFQQLQPFSQVFILVNIG